MSYTVDGFSPEDVGFHLNFADHELPADQTLIPAGNYVATITATEWGETSERSKNPDQPKLTAAFVIASGPHKGHTLSRVYVFSDAAFFFFYGLCQATGKFTDEELSTAKFSANELDKRLLGSTVVLSVAQKEDRFSTRGDGLRNEVGRAFALDSPRGRQVTALVGAPDPRMP